MLKTSLLSFRPRLPFLLLGATTLGIVLAPVLPLSPGLCYALGGLILLVGLALRHGFAVPESVVVLLLVLPWTFLGAGRTRDVMLPRPDDISQFVGQPSVRVRGVVVSDVEGGSFGSYRLTLAARQVNDYRAIRAVSGQVQVTVLAPAVPPGKWASDTRLPDRPPLPGDFLELRGRVEAIPLPELADDFNYRVYLERRGVFSQLKARYPGDMQISRPASERDVLVVAQRFRDGLSATTHRHLARSEAGLLNALLLSVSYKMPADLKRAFERTGTVHILSVSGLHMTALAVALTYLLTFAPVSRKVASLGSMAALWLFALASGGSAAAMRSVLMASVVLAAPLFRRVPEMLHSLSFAAFLLLLFSPGMLYEIGFQLSFAYVGTLLLWVPPLLQLLFPENRRQGWQQRGMYGLGKALLIGFVAQVGSAPLLLYHFGQLSVIAPLANLPIAFLSELLVLGGLAISSVTGILDAVCPPLSVVMTPFWGLLSLGLSVLQGLALGFARLPWSVLEVNAPPIWGVLVFYGVLIVGGVWLRPFAFTRREQPNEGD